MKPRKATIACWSAVVLISTAAAIGQPQLPLPEASTKASVGQTVGIASVQVSYHRPGVKARPVWGALVPYGEVWRAGANENTTISFSHPVKVSGKDLAAGTYGVHMIPTQTEWTIIFSKNATSWGSYFYKESEDALRVTVKPQASVHTELLRYDFESVTDTSALLSLAWEKLRVNIPLGFDTRGLVIANARENFLRGMAGFTWQGFNQAAAYCARNIVNLPEALKWADQSIGLGENFTNLYTKAMILDLMGNSAGAAALRERAMTIATEADINTLGYTLMNANKTKEAIAMFEKNVKGYPNSWNVYDSLAEGLEKSGDTKRAIANYEEALRRVADERNKKRITDTLVRLRSH